jgi:hypothetical protein
VKGLAAIADRLAKGSSTLSLRLARGTVAWLQAGKGVGDFLIRLGFLSLPLWVLYALVMATRALLWVVAVLWCIGAWRAAAPAKSRTTPPPRSPAPSRPEEAAQGTAPESGGGVRVISTPDPANPARTRVRVEDVDTDAPQ